MPRHQPAAGGFLRWPYPLGEVGCCPPPPGVPGPSASRSHPHPSQVLGAPDQAFSLPTVLTAPHPLLQQRVHPQPRLRQRQREQGGHGAGAPAGLSAPRGNSGFPRDTPPPAQRDASELGPEGQGRTGQQQGALLCPLFPVAVPSDLASPHCPCPGRVQPLLSFCPHPGAHWGRQPQACPPSSCAALHGASGGVLPAPSLGPAGVLPSALSLASPSAQSFSRHGRGATRADGTRALPGPRPGVLPFP